MIITHRMYRTYDTPLYIHYLSVFVACLFDDNFTESEKSCFRLFDDEGHLIGRAAIYQGV